MRSLTALREKQRLNLHSNLVIFKFATTQRRRCTIPQFTFQSGDIQILHLKMDYNRSIRFTFQSGDIQIPNSGSNGAFPFFIYIPIW